MKIVIQFIVVGLLVSTFAAAPVNAEESGREELAEQLRASFVEQLQADAVSELTSAGLAELDALRMVDQLSFDATNCALDAAEQGIRDAGEDPDLVFSTAEPEDLARWFKDGDEFDASIETCLLTAISNAGLTP
ncbi:MAG: hypothetical protein AAGJ86_03070 [Pseudomonadota bacterium]